MSTTAQRRAAALCILALAGCDAPVDLLVEVRSDFVPGFEVSRVDVELDGVPESSQAVGDDADLVSGLRVAELGPITRGAHEVRVRLFDPAGEPLAQRASLVDLQRTTALVVILARDCRGVVCPRADDAPDATECAGGGCVPPGCHPGAPEACGPPECTSSSDCERGVACSAPICASGTCLLGHLDSRCAAGERCDPQRGCVETTPQPDAGPPDAGPPDSGPPDAGPPDSGPPDSGPPDSGPPDAGPPDAGPPDACAATVETCDGVDQDCDGRVDEAPASCPCPRLARGGSSYLHCPDRRPWMDARDVCRGVGYDLVTIEDDAENSFLDAAVSEDTFIGLHDPASDGVFVWASGSASAFRFWAPGEPFDSGGQDCVGMRGTGLWDDMTCTASRRYLCESLPR